MPGSSGWFDRAVTKDELVRAAYDAWNARDADRLVAMTHADVEIAPLVVGLVSVGPWHGHDGVRKLVADAEARWSRFEITCDEVSEFGDRAVAFVHVVVAAKPAGTSVSGDIAHLIEFEGDLVKSFVAYRERDDAIAAAQD